MSNLINKKSIAVIGGDRRQCALASFFAENGYNVRVFGLGETISERFNGKIDVFDDIYEAIGDEKDIKDLEIVFPLPVSNDGIFLNCPLYKQAPPRIDDIFGYIGKITGSGEKRIYGGRFSPKVKEFAENHSLGIYDYSETEEFQIKNALPTAEGALSIAMNELDVTLFSSRTAVIGYGRIGKVLAHLLSSFGSEVTVAVRKERDTAMAECFGHKTLKIEVKDGQSSLIRLCDGYDVIFNTVPYWLIGREILEKMNKKTFIVDLASSPGGVDILAAQDNGIKSIWALSLPGKYAPISAGRIIGECLIGKF